jgi:glycosyltransferase involved in cell wall biosynthesis
MPPLVDIFLPHYRGARFIEKAVGSLMAQTHEHWRLTVVDDASEDDSVETVRRIVASDPSRMQLIVQQQNRGAAAARMSAARETSAELIAFLDQDDAWHPEKLALQIRHMLDHIECGAVHTDVVFIDEADGEIRGAGDVENARRASIDWGGSHEELSRQLFARNSIRIISSMVRRNAFGSVGGFDESLRGGEDWEFWTRFAASARIHHLPLPLLQRRLHDANTVTSQRYPRSLNKLKAWGKLVSEHPHLRPLASRRRRQLLRGARDAAREAGNPGQAALLSLRLNAQRLGLRI